MWRGSLALVAVSLPWLVGSCGDGESILFPSPTEYATEGLTGSGASATAGYPLEDLPGVRVSDEAGNPAPGVKVEFRVEEGEGSVEPDRAVTDAEGRVRPTRWVLGEAAGINVLVADMGDLGEARFQVEGEPGPPRDLEQASDSAKGGRVGEPVDEPPAVAVADEFGNPVPDVAVAFEPEEGAGSVEGSPALTDADGTARVAAWELGPTAGDQALVARVAEPTDTDAAPLTIVARADPGPPHGFEAAEDSVPEGQVATTVEGFPAARVVDEFGNPVPAVSLTFEARAGAGTVHGGSVTTDEDGVGRAESWELGTIAGIQEAEVRISEGPGEDLDPGLVEVVARPGPAEALEPAAPTSQTGTAGEPASEAPAVRVEDAFENAVPGVSVDFTVTEGGGDVTGSPATSGDDGVAEVGSWTLGPEPGANRVEASVPGLDVSPVIFEAEATVLSVAAVHLNQGSQDLPGTIGAVAGRPGLLRVVLEAGGTGTEAPDVLVRFSRQGNVVWEEILPPPTATVPTDPDLASVSDTWDLSLLGPEVVSGLEVEVVADPDSVLATGERSGFRYPEDGGAVSLDVQPLAPLRLELFPIHWEEEDLTGDIHAGNVDDFLVDTERWIPSAEIEPEVRSPFSTDQDLRTSDGWLTLLSDLQAVRDAEGAQDEYYHGIIPDFPDIPAAGLAYVPSSPDSPYRTGLTYDRFPYAPGTLAHELGHNLGQFHAPCGNPAGVDDGFPYADGGIGVPGYDVRTGEIVDPATHADYMSYCTPRWTSDYMFGRILEWRRADPLAAALGAQAETAANPARRSPRASGGSAAAAGGMPGLLLWGRAGPGGVVLNPAFALESSPSLPVEDGGKELRGLDGDGREVFRLSFAGAVPSTPHGTEERHFSFFVPLEPGELDALERIELSTRWGSAVQAAPGAGPGAARPQDVRDGRVELEAVAPERLRLRWDAGGPATVLVRHRQTGEILGIGRGGELALPSRGLGRDHVEVLVSDGVRSRLWDR